MGDGRWCLRWCAAARDELEAAPTYIIEIDPFSVHKYDRGSSDQM